MTLTTYAIRDRETLRWWSNKRWAGSRALPTQYKTIEHAQAKVDKLRNSVKACDPEIVMCRFTVRHAI